LRFERASGKIVLQEIDRRFIGMTNVFKKTLERISDDVKWLCPSTQDLLQSITENLHQDPIEAIKKLKAECEERVRSLRADPYQGECPVFPYGGE
jgi:hypothetical protein